MSESLQSAWQQSEWYLQNGFSVIPVADRQMEYKGKTREAKKPLLDSWALYQKQIISNNRLFEIMDDTCTTGLAMVCGKVSGNVEAIDVDVKNKSGIDAVLLQDLKLLYPSLIQKLRIHRTPSGGIHIPYRIQDAEVPNSRKLASRPATQKELEIKPKEKAKSFIETRGERSYILVPPSRHYSVIQDKPVPVLTWEERCNLITLCESYNEVIKVEKGYTPPKSAESMYDENPFEHFNNTCDPVTLLEEFGWDEFRQSPRFIWFTRPGKSEGVSASFNKQKRVFYIFTSSTELENERGYLPATILAELKFSGDKKKTYAHLVENGYGKVKPTVEERTVRLTAMRGGKLPGNFSESSRRQLEKEFADIETKYPYGIFWFEEDDIIKISREGIYTVAAGMGFRLFRDQVVQISSYTVKKVTDRAFFDALKGYVAEERERDRERICNAFEAFIQNAGKFTVSRLQILDDSAFVQDDRNTAFKFYQNGFLAITKDGYQLLDYETIHGLVWEHKIHPRDFNEGHQTVYRDFLNLAVEFDKHEAHIKKIIGYLAHEYKDETTGYIIAITEQCPDPKQGGGSGKNIFCSMLSQTTTYMSIPGTQIQYNEKFLQSWNGERVFCISDPDKKFNWGFLKEISTGAGIIKKLWKDEATVPTNELPKFVVTTNYSYEINDGGLKRRIVNLEFTDFFTRCGGVDVHFSKHFPRDWTAEDFNGFDTLMAECIQEWLAGGLKLSAVPLTESGWLKQFDQQYGQLTREFIQEKWSTFFEKKGFVSNDDFQSWYEWFCNVNNIQRQYRLTSQKMNHALETWCTHYAVSYTKDAKGRDMLGIEQRGRRFIKWD